MRVNQYPSFHMGKVLPCVQNGGYVLAVVYRDCFMPFSLEGVGSLS